MRAYVRTRSLTVFGRIRLILLRRWWKTVDYGGRGLWSSVGVYLSSVLPRRSAVTGPVPLQSLRVLTFLTRAYYYSASGL